MKLVITQLYGEWDSFKEYESIFPPEPFYKGESRILD
jgi:hypothetical protein